MRRWEYWTMALSGAIAAGAAATAGPMSDAHPFWASAVLVLGVGAALGCAGLIARRMAPLPRRLRRGECRCPQCREARSRC